MLVRCSVVTDALGVAMVDGDVRDADVSVDNRDGVVWMVEPAGQSNARAAEVAMWASKKSRHRLRRRCRRSEFLAAVRKVDVGVRLVDVRVALERASVAGKRAGVSLLRPSVSFSRPPDASVSACRAAMRTGVAMRRASAREGATAFHRREPTLLFREGSVFRRDARSATSPHAFCPRARASLSEARAGRS